MLSTRDQVAIKVKSQDELDIQNSSTPKQTSVEQYIKQIKEQVSTSIFLKSAPKNSHFLAYFLGFARK